MYPHNSEEALQLDTFVAWRTVASIVMAATGGFAIWLLFQIVYEGNPPNINKTLALMALVALTIGVVYMALSAIKPDHLHRQYNQKADFEERLYHLVEHIAGDRDLTKEQKQRLFTHYVNLVKGVLGSRQHFLHTPSELSGQLQDAIKMMRQEEGRQITHHIAASDGTPASSVIKTYSDHCTELEGIAKALNPSVT